MQPVTIQQPAPCHESWAAMTPTAQGRHCAACQTEVVDFTRMTDAEVVAFVRHTVPGRRCGKFREDQLGQPLMAAAQPVTGRRRWVVAGILLLGSVYGMKARAQGMGQNPAPDEGARKSVTGSAAVSAIPDSLFLIQGVVRNWWGVRQVGARVKVGWINTTTDAKGHFSVRIPHTSRGNIRYITVNGKSLGVHVYLRTRIPFDSARTRPYHIRLRRVVEYLPGFY